MVLWDLKQIRILFAADRKGVIEIGTRVGYSLIRSILLTGIFVVSLSNLLIKRVSSLHQLLIAFCWATPFVLEKHWFVS